MALRGMRSHVHECRVQDAATNIADGFFCRFCTAGHGRRRTIMWRLQHARLRRRVLAPRRACPTIRAGSLRQLKVLEIPPATATATACAARGLWCTARLWNRHTRHVRCCGAPRFSHRRQRRRAPGGAHVPTVPPVVGRWWLVDRALRWVRSRDRGASPCRQPHAGCVPLMPLPRLGSPATGARHHASAVAVVARAGAQSPPQLKACAAGGQGSAPCQCRRLCDDRAP